MKYSNFFLHIFKKLKKTLITFLLIIIFILFFIYSEGYSLEDLGINLNPNDYCNLTDVEYTAILHDDPNRKANVEITEYLTFDIHAASESNTFKELWRELPEDTVDGLRVTYDVKSVTQILPNGQEIEYLETPIMYWEDSDYTRNSTYRWHHSDGSGVYPDNDESLLIYIPWTYRDKLTFRITYSLNNAALKYNDCSELYLSMYSGNTIKKLNSYKAQILIPNNLMPSEYYAYTFGTKNDRLPFEESDTLNPGYHTFSLALNKSDLKFDYHNRYIEFCLLSYGKDKHIFTKYAPNNNYTTDNVLDECIAENEYYENKTKTLKKYKSLLFICSILGTFLIIHNTKNKYNKIKNKYQTYEPETDYTFFREIPSDLDPMFASELAFMKDPYNKNKSNQEEYAAILLSLVRKKYITITKLTYSEDWSDSNTLITLEPIKSSYQTSEYNTLENISEPIYKTINEITGYELEPLTTSERLYYELLERHSKKLNGSITLSKLQEELTIDYIYTNAFIKDISKKPALENGVMEGYFQTTDYTSPQRDILHSASMSFLWGIIFIFVVNLISYFTPMSLCYGAYTIIGLTYFWKYIYLSIHACEVIPFTQLGVNEQAKWYGLYNFLNSDTLMSQSEICDLILWEKYLIYATAFGISEKVIKALKIHAVELNINTSPVLNNHSYIHSSSFHSTSRSFKSSIHTSSINGSYGGHGYGGGGRGGGGGGGGH